MLLLKCISVFKPSKSKYLTFYYSTKSAKCKWKCVVGLEVHAQILTTSKLFSGAATEFASPVNTNAALFDVSIPGTLPVLNKKCVESAVLTALALNCRVNPVSAFDRKHYFYADMPAGYQITQQRSPLANDGKLEFQVFTPGIHKKPYTTEVNIKQIQLEQDSGKSLHDVDRSLVDLNRAGAALMELVFEPDLTDGEEAAALIKELSIILQRINTCSCKMEEGALRVDANVSIHKEGEELGTRTEIKNINSVRAVANAVRFEIERQIKIKDNGGVIVNETRAWDAMNKSTVGMRDKEELQDYRYMPEPNLPPLHVAINEHDYGVVKVNEIKKQIPELPNETRLRLENAGLTPEQSTILVNDFFLMKIFDNCLTGAKLEPKLLANILINELNKLLNEKEMDSNELFNLTNNPLNHIIETIELLQSKKINRNTAQLLFGEIINGNNDTPTQIVADKKLFQISDEKELTELCKQVLQENDKIVRDYKNGKIKVFKAFLGSIAIKSQNRADMEKCNKILKQLLQQ